MRRSGFPIACALATAAWLAAPAGLHAEDAPAPATAAAPAKDTSETPATQMAPAKPAAGRLPAHGATTAPRTLEDIRIEGDIPVPQVLFITARDQRRFMDLHHHRYLRSSLDLGERTVGPTALTVLRAPVSGERKETSP